MTLSVHVLDLSRGMPAHELEVVLHRRSGESRKEVARARTDSSGRIAAPFGGDLQAGDYEMEFAAGAYFTNAGTASFYDAIPVRFRIDRTGHYHVPLLLSPWGYSTYKGS